MVGGRRGHRALAAHCAGFQQIGNRVVTILGGRSKDFLILEEDLRPVSDDPFHCYG